MILARQLLVCLFCTWVLQPPFALGDEAENALLEMVCIRHAASVECIYSLSGELTIKGEGADAFISKLKFAEKGNVRRYRYEIKTLEPAEPDGQAMPDGPGPGMRTPDREREGLIEGARCHELVLPDKGSISQSLVYPEDLWSVGLMRFSSAGSEIQAVKKIADQGKVLTYVKLSHKHGTSEFWFDPAANYLVQKLRSTYVVTTNNEARTFESESIVVGFRERRPGVFFPDVVKSYAIDRSGKKTLMRTATFSNIKINEPIPLESLRFQFPPGILVRDNITQGEFKTGAKGELIPVKNTPVPANKNVAVPPGPGRRISETPPQAWPRWLFPAGWAVLVAAAMLWYLQKLRGWRELRTAKKSAIVLSMTVAIFGLVLEMQTGHVRQLWASAYDGPVLDVPAEVVLSSHPNVLSGPGAPAFLPGSHVVLEGRFRMRNKGRSKLSVTVFKPRNVWVRNEQGAEVRTLAFDIPPQEDQEVIVRLPPAGPVGSEIHEEVHFRTSDPDRPEARVTLLGPKVRGGVVLTPSLVEFGNVIVGRKAQQRVTIRDSAIVQRTISGVKAASKNVSAHFVPRAAGDKDKSLLGPDKLLGHMEITVAPEIPSRIWEELEVFVDKYGGHAPDRVRVVARAVPLVQALPGALVLPRASGRGPLFHADCLCKSNDGAPLNLLLEDPPTDVLVQVSSTADVASEKLVRIEWKGAADRLPASRCLRFRAIAGNETTRLKIPIHIETRRNSP